MYYTRDAFSSGFDVKQLSGKGILDSNENTKRGNPKGRKMNITKKFALLGAVFAVFAAGADGLPDDATGTPLNAATAIGDVMVVDISGGAAATSYPVTYYQNVDMGYFNCDAYKTTKIVLRKIPAGEAYLCSPGQAVNTTVSDTITPNKDYYIGLFEVTCEQWYKVMGGTEPTGDVEKMRAKCNVSYSEIRSGDATAFVRANDPLAYLSFMGQLSQKCTSDPSKGFDLPTGVQWEIAARAGSTAYNGSYLDSNGSAKSISGAHAGWWTSNKGPDIYGMSDCVHVVGLMEPNPWGLYDTFGNAAEFCLDEYGATQGSDAETPYLGTGGTSGNAIKRFALGGYQGQGGANCSSSARASINYISCKSSDDNHGFRLCYMDEGRQISVPADYFWVENLSATTGCYSFQLKKAGSPDAVTLEYAESPDASTWTSYAAGGTMTIPKGKRYYFRRKSGASSTLSKGTGSYYYFQYQNCKSSTLGIEIAVGGNLMSLLDGSLSATDTVGNYAFYKLFNGLIKLKLDPSFKLPATTLASSCYASMFYGCTSLTSAPALPATTLVTSCYQSMFSGCTSLTAAPELPATAVAVSCYQSMFSGCTSLTSAPALPATSLDSFCYESMFSGCTSLTSAPALPATTLRNYCYQSMFQGCTSLTSAPALPATTLAIYCYQSMFQGCTSLTSAELSATSLGTMTGCCDNMFDGCMALREVTAGLTSWLAPNQTDWLKDVALHGVLFADSLTPTTPSSSTCPEGWLLLKKSDGWPVGADGTEVYAWTNGTDQLVIAGDGTVNSLSGIPTEILSGIKDLTIVGSLVTNAVADAFTGLGTAEAPVTVTFWGDWQGALPEAGEPWYGANAKNPPEPDYLSFKAVGGDFKIGMTSGLSFGLETSFTKARGSWTPFIPGETEVSVLEGQTIYFRCGDDVVHKAADQKRFVMTSTRDNPQVEAGGNLMTLIDRDNQTATVTYTLHDHAFEGLFSGCALLTTAHLMQLPVTNLATYCYASMFQGCTSLIEAPELPAMSLARYCYYSMFQGCTSLIEAPELPATTLFGYCYRNMFTGCKKLNAVRVHFTAWSPLPTGDWLDGVAPEGVFRCPTGLPLTRGPSNIPEGWLVMPETWQVGADGEEVYAWTNGTERLVIVGDGTIESLSKVDDLAGLLAGITNVTIYGTGVTNAAATAFAGLGTETSPVTVVFDESSWQGGLPERNPALWNGGWMYLSGYIPPARVVIRRALQRYPWNGKIDVDYAVDGDGSDYALVLTLAANGTNWTATAANLSGDVTLVDGMTEAVVKRVTWDAAADCGTDVVDKNATLTLSLVKKDE